MPAWCSPLSLWSPMSSQPGCLEQGHPSGKAGCWSLSSLQGVDTARKKVWVLAWCWTMGWDGMEKKMDVGVGGRRPGAASVWLATMCTTLRSQRERERSPLPVDGQGVLGCVGWVRG
ncbi:hypothetical protein CCHR01_18887 [Colletotrichum chrysophilum]|uniref:Uncharacterized protein n=1 Tax=Colletotrichum chrysophilum TaxID=1836956 RepID=A0AAD8ZZI0_9PEZI|nr:hypothetical protein CCHR01_18887 [Colletotrichum chrysophilum]